MWSFFWPLGLKLVRHNWTLLYQECFLHWQYKKLRTSKLDDLFYHICNMLFSFVKLTVKVKCEHKTLNQIKTTVKIGNTGCEVFKRTLLNFENWVNGEVSKIGHHFKVFLKLRLSKNFSIKKMLLNWYSSMKKQAWKFSACKRSLSFNKTGPLS